MGKFKVMLSQFIFHKMDEGHIPLKVLQFKLSKFSLISIRKVKINLNFSNASKLR